MGLWAKKYHHWIKRNSWYSNTLYEFTQNNEVVDITAYIWMEGCGV